MKLRRLYSNNPDLFRAITFNPGLNVVYGRVNKPKDSLKSSHNLGKSLLAQVIDFCLLKGVTKNHFFKKNVSLFQGLVLFLELELNDQTYLTIRRPVEANTKISFWLRSAGGNDLSQEPLDSWPEKPSSLEAARAALNEHLNFDTLGRYDYRKGISYFLRSQDDYRDVFQLSKFSNGKHIDWKPFMALLLGFSENTVRQKYEVDDAISEERVFAARYSAESGAHVESFDKIRGLLTIKTEEVQSLETISHEFDIHRSDTQLNEELVNTLEKRNAEINDRIYTIDYELTQIDEALDKKLRFDLERIKIVFDQASLILPDELIHSYEDLLQFNRDITEDRNARLENRLRELRFERQSLSAELGGINKSRTEALSVLRGEDWFKRFKDLQSQIARLNVEIGRLGAQLESVNRLEEFQRTIEAYESSRSELISAIREEIRKSNPTFELIRKRFNEMFRTVFGVPALLSVQLNADGNMEFEANAIQDDLIPRATSEGEGHTYKKVLCASFDLALLEAYRTRSFYRFVYHDGIFESLDDRQKLNLLQLIRNSCHQAGIQYMLSVIDSDIPRNPMGRRVYFSDAEVVLELHDDGDDGRLFRMPKF